MGSDSYSDCSWETFVTVVAVASEVAGARPVQRVAPRATVHYLLTVWAVLQHNTQRVTHSSLHSLSTPMVHPHLELPMARFSSQAAWTAAFTRHVALVVQRLLALAPTDEDLRNSE